MTVDQIATLSLLAAVVVLFIWGRWRVDAVAMLALMAAFSLGLVPSETVFSGFGHPAVITVAAVLALSSALARSGVVDLIAAWVERFAATRLTQLVALSTLGGAMSGFMNNVGALALLMPVALSMAKRTGYSASLVLMPLSFATILGGLVTLIGTPPNVIIAQYHQKMTGHGFQLFDFAWTGIPMAVVGILFLTLVGWRLIPSSGQNRAEGDAPFDIDSYLTELVVPQGAKVVGKTIDDIAEEMETPPQFDGIVRGRTRVIRRLHAGEASGGRRSARPWRHGVDRGAGLQGLQDGRGQGSEGRGRREPDRHGCARRGRGGGHPALLAGGPDAGSGHAQGALRHQPAGHRPLRRTDPEPAARRAFPGR
ncbi:MAG: SLC13 family permease [Thalassobaculum sp.]